MTNTCRNCKNCKKGKQGAAEKAAVESILRTQRKLAWERAKENQTEVIKPQSRRPQCALNGCENSSANGSIWCFQHRTISSRQK